MIRNCLFIAILSSAWAPWLAHAQDAGYYTDKARGWFWYETEPDPEVFAEPPPQDPVVIVPPPPVPPEPALQPPAAAPAPVVVLAPFSSEWIRENLPKYRDRAVDEPTPENVRAYMYLQRLVVDKSERFADVAQAVVMGDPMLDENTRRPIASFGAKLMDDQARKNHDAQLKALAKVTGIWFFFRSDCEFCHAQAPVLHILERLYGFKVQAVSLDGRPLPGGEFPNFLVDRGQAAMLGVDTTPSLFLVRPPRIADHVLITEGLLAADEIAKRILVLAGEAGWLSPTQVAATRPVKKHLMPSDVSKNAPATSSPKELTDYLRARLKASINR